MGCALLHTFNWQFTDVAAHALEISAAGYYGVLLPPPIYSSEIGSKKAWWQFYQPRDYRVISSHLGGRQDLSDAIKALHQHGVKVYIDFVANHMANERRDQSDAFQYPGADTLKDYANQPDHYQANRLYGDLAHGLFSPWDFHQAGTLNSAQDYRDRQRAMHWRLADLPDLRPSPWVMEQQRQCLDALVDMGADGFRIDAVKHLHPHHIRTVFEPLQARGLHLFGEVLTTNDQEEGIFLNPFLEETSLDAYDFPLFLCLRWALGLGGDLGFLFQLQTPQDALPPMRAVTFAVNHDLPLNDGFRSLVMHERDEYLAWVFLLGRDGGMPLIYSDTNLSDNGRWHGFWHRDSTKAMLRFHNIMHGLVQRELWRSAHHIAFRRGDIGVVTINKSDAWQDVYFDSYGSRLGRYRDLLNGSVFQLQAGQNRLAIPPREAQLWVHEDAW